MKTTFAAPIAAVLALSLPLHAAEWSVQPDGSGDFATIQAAVDGAAVGDVIVLEDGLFVGTGNRDVDFGGKDVTVRSRNGAAFTTIDSQGASGDPHRAFRLDSGETSAARIEGLTITGGFVEGVFPESGGGGILVAYGTHPTIVDCIFEDNEAGFEGFGAGLLAWEDCDITLQDCIFRNNTSGWYGGGFTLRKFCDALVERVWVEGNYSLHAGGGASITNSNAIVNDCTFIDNETTEVDGGGLLVKAGALPVLNRCVFVGNRAYAGGGLGLGNDPHVTLNDCVFENNYASHFGGAICLDQNPSSLTATNCTFVNNRAEIYGGHIFGGFNSTTTLRQCVLGAWCNAPWSVAVAAGAVADIDCTLLLGGQSTIWSSIHGTVQWGADNVDTDPMFCGPDACGAPLPPTADWQLQSESPAANHSCGLLGALGVGCGTTGISGMSTMTWGEVKAHHRVGR